MMFRNLFHLINSLSCNFYKQAVLTGILVILQTGFYKREQEKVL